MNIVGLETLVFDVDDLQAGHQFLVDYGLTAVEITNEGGRYEALDGTGVEIRRIDDPQLPLANAPSPNLRETIYGVADTATLEAIAIELAKDREVVRDEQGAIHSIDDGGFAIGFCVTRRKEIKIKSLNFNVPGQGNGRAPNELGCHPDEEHLPFSLSHVVYFVPDMAKAEAFYCDRLGFVVTDRFRKLGPFMRPAGTLEHHSLFMIQSFNEHMVGAEHFTFHFGSANSVFHSGWRFAQKGYKSFWGPGRHELGSNYFWYFKSPFGCNIEFDADMDLHDDEWIPRERDPGAHNSQIFLFQHAPKWFPSGD
ncbi:VOC family protein [Acinetobacter baumannii]|nr:VOC family protein [Acinetobacter baumannii]